MLIRPALLADAAGITRVHVDSWRTTYKGIMPDELLANISFEKREQHWTKLLTQPGPGKCHLVAEDEAKGIVGIASGGPTITDCLGYTGELYAIYLLKEAQGAGTGRALFQAVTAFLKKQGHESMMLWVLEENHPSRRFYERLGGHPVHRKGEEFGGKSLTEIAYGYDLTKL